MLKVKKARPRAPQNISTTHAITAQAFSVPIVCLLVNFGRFTSLNNSLNAIKSYCLSDNTHHKYTINTQVMQIYLLNLSKIKPNSVWGCGTDVYFAGTAVLICENCLRRPFRGRGHGPRFDIFEEQLRISTSVS